MDDDTNTSPWGTTPEPGVSHIGQGWNARKSSLLPVEGEVFPLTFPFIEQAFALTTRPMSATGIFRQ
jgi:hypothetical protein